MNKIIPLPFALEKARMVFFTVIHQAGLRNDLKRLIKKVSKKNLSSDEFRIRLKIMRNSTQNIEFD